MDYFSGGDGAFPAGFESTEQSTLDRPNGGS